MLGTSLGPDLGWLENGKNGVILKGFFFMKESLVSVVNGWGPFSPLFGLPLLPFSRVSKKWTLSNRPLFVLSQIDNFGCSSQRRTPDFA